MKKPIEMESPKRKRCPECGGRRFRKLLGEQTGGGSASSAKGKGATTGGARTREET